MRQHFCKCDKFAKLRASVLLQRDEPLFSQEQVRMLRAIWQEWFRCTGHAALMSWHVEEGQPYSLDALQALSQTLQDPDSANHAWSLEDADFKICTVNWMGARDAPELLESLVQTENSMLGSLRRCQASTLPRPDGPRLHWASSTSSTLRGASQG